MRNIRSFNNKVFGLVAAFVVWSFGISTAAAYEYPNYTRTTLSSDTSLSCGSLNVEISDIERDLGIIQGYIDYEQSNMSNYSSSSYNGGGDAFGALLGAGVNMAARNETQRNLQQLRSSYSTANARRNYLQTLQRTCSN